MTLGKQILVIVWLLWSHSFAGIKGGSERQKREIRFPKGSSFVAAVALASFLPKGPTDGLAHVLEFDLGFPFPDEFAFGKNSNEKMKWKHHSKTISSKLWYKTKKPKAERNLKEVQQKNLLLKIEDVLNRIGLRGSSCASRFQCELRSISPKTSLLEELLFAMFKNVSEPDDYDCEMHSRSCPISLLHLIMHSEHISSSQ